VKACQWSNALKVIYFYVNSVVLLLLILTRVVFDCSVVAIPGAGFGCSGSNSPGITDHTGRHSCRVVVAVTAGSFVGVEVVHCSNEGCPARLLSFSKMEPVTVAS